MKTLIVALLFVIAGLIGSLVYDRVTSSVHADHRLPFESPAGATNPSVPLAIKSTGGTSSSTDSGPNAISGSRPDTIPTPPPFDWDHAPADPTQVVMFLAAAAAGDSSHLPKRGVVYPATGLQVIQKVPGGYVVTQFDPAGVMGTPIPVYIETNEVFGPNQVVGGSVRYLGPYRYTGLDGFEHSLMHFQLRPRAR